MTRSQPNSSLIPTFETGKSFYVVGCSGEFDPGATQAIGALWGDFFPRAGELRDRVGDATFGVSFPPGLQADDPSKFIYVAGVEVASLDDIPNGMVGFEMPARHYAVFAHENGLGPQLAAEVSYIFETWLPNSDYTMDGGDYEFYDDRFDPTSDQGVFFRYVAVKPGS